jgi:branched-chain amino acid transport system ATP-binding protein
LVADQPVLAVKNLGASYGPVQVLRAMDWTLQQGTCLALLGANGSGKTTLLRGLAGAVVLRTGSIVFEQREISRLPAHEISRLGIALVPEGRHLFAALTVEENLRAGAFILRKQGRYSTWPDAEARVLKLFPRLAERRAQPAGTLSGGEQQMLAVARALIGQPKLLLLDEPTVGLAPKVVHEMFGAFAQLKNDGLTIVVAEQHVPPALDLADRALVLKLGAVALDAPSSELKGSTQLKKLYMGG